MNLPVFLISLDKDTARRQRLKERFGEYENFTLISAVDGRIISTKEYFALVMPSLRLHGRLMSPAEVGCTLSHVKAYEAFIASGEQRALFIEDDVIGDDSCIKFAFETARELPLNGVLLCGCQDGLPARFSAFGKRIRDARNLSAERLPTPINGKDRSLFAVLPRSYGAICSTAAYVLTREAAQKLLDTHKGTLSTTNADFALAISGIAGPGGGTASKPVGTVYVAAGDRNGNIEAERLLLKGERNYVREQSVLSAYLCLLRLKSEIFFA